jgi:hypothetical protein
VVAGPYLLDTNALIWAAASPGAVTWPGEIDLASDATYRFRLSQQCLYLRRKLGVSTKRLTLSYQSGHVEMLRYLGVVHGV